ncbi:hypothetical protein [Gilvibacter sediminis]|uniref:hypothetical protein n=1 Tax=Gilvibacter sediminis TaxID=379071 RepID=UPI002350311D|nr:hypothetical protein [Gilvibacter sediminis]MDC7997519.1 hypothetical protein [Gilvibacter sediminis]
MKYLLLIPMFLCSLTSFAQQKDSTAVAQFKAYSIETKAKTTDTVKTALVGRPELTPYAISSSDTKAKASDTLKLATPELKPFGKIDNDR